MICFANPFLGTTNSREIPRNRHSCKFVPFVVPLCAYVVLNSSSCIQITFSVQFLTSEIYQQTQFTTCCFQIIKNLSFMFRRDFRNCFQLHDNLVIAKQISLVTLLQHHILILNRQSHLCFKRDVSFTHFHFKSLMIHGFQKARTQHPMDFHCCPYYIICLLCVYHFLFVYLIYEQLQSNLSCKFVQFVVP